MFFNNTFLDSPFGTVAVLVSSNSFVPKGTCLLTKFNSGKPQSQKNVPSFSGNGSFFTTLLKPEKTGKTQIRVFQSRSGKTKELFAMGPGAGFRKPKKGRWPRKPCPKKARFSFISGAGRWMFLGGNHFYDIRIFAGICVKTLQNLPITYSMTAWKMSLERLISVNIDGFASTAIPEKTTSAKGLFLSF